MTRCFSAALPQGQCIVQHRVRPPIRVEGRDVVAKRLISRPTVPTRSPHHLPTVSTSAFDRRREPPQMVPDWRAR